MRSIPFKQVCLLGMNDGEYPRPRIPSGFDLMNITASRLGDRSGREDDRYLFLEALMSVRERLYISYCGRSVQDNSERFPSVLVSELQAYCRQYFELETNAEMQDKTEDIVEFWTTHHRLQAFHPSYYLANGEQGPTTYAAQWLDLHQARAEETAMSKAAKTTDQKDIVSRPETARSREGGETKISIWQGWPRLSSTRFATTINSIWGSKLRN